MSDPLISVIIPIYNIETYLDRCISSVVSQTFRNLDIILVDDGSTDKSPDICEQWVQKDKRIQVIHKKNGGLSDARNAGILNAKGNYISFVDGDDYIEPDFLEVLLALISKYGAQISEVGTRITNDQNVTLKERGIPASEICLGRIDAIKRLIIESGLYQTVWNKLYVADLVKEVPFKVGKFHEDDFWTYQVFDKVEKLAATNKPLYNYVQRKGSIMDNGYTLRRLDGLEARYERLFYLEKYPELSDFLNEQFMFNCLWHLQSSYRYLKEEERDAAIHYILTLKESISIVPFGELQANNKYKIWYELFRFCPKITAHVRNTLKIGI